MHRPTKLQHHKRLDVDERYWFSKVSQQSCVDRIKALFLQPHVLYGIKGGVFNTVFALFHDGLSVDYVQQRRLDVSHHDVFP